MSGLAPREEGSFGAALVRVRDDDGRGPSAGAAEPFVGTYGWARASQDKKISRLRTTARCPRNCVATPSAPGLCRLWDRSHISKPLLVVEAPCNSPPIECLSSFLFPIISRTAPSGLDRGPIFIFYFPGIRRYAWLALANSPDVAWAKLNRGRSRASVLVRKRGRTASKWTNNRQLTYPAGGIC